MANTPSNKNTKNSNSFDNTGYKKPILSLLPDTAITRSSCNRANFLRQGARRLPIIDNNNFVIGELTVTETTRYRQIILVPKTHYTIQQMKLLNIVWELMLQADISERTTLYRYNNINRKIQTR